MSEQVVLCEMCGRQAAMDVRARPLKGGGEEQFMKCPHCKARYLIARLTPKAVKLRRDIQARRRSGQGIPEDDPTLLEFRKGVTQGHGQVLHHGRLR